MRSTVIAALLYSLQSTPQTPDARDTCVVSGRVVNAETGEGVRKAEVSISRENDRDVYPPVQSGENGAFAFRDLKPGRYRIFARRAGFVRQYYGARKPGDQSNEVIAVSSGQEVKEVVLKLTPHGVITGRVYDEDGELKPSVHVRAFIPKGNDNSQPVSDSGSGLTNDIGEYRIAGIPPGNYVVVIPTTSDHRYASARQGPLPEKPEDAYAATFYPGVTNPAVASTVSVRAGAETQNIDIRLSMTQVFRVRGRIIDSRTGRPGQAHLSLELSGRVQTYWRESRSLVVENDGGLFEFTGVRPGSYVLRANSMGSDASRIHAVVPVTVAASHVAGIEMVMTGGTDLPGRIRHVGKLKGRGGDRLATRPDVSLFPIDSEDGGMGAGTESINEDGTFLLKQVRPGRYRVETWGFGHAYVQRVLLGDQEVTNTGLDFTSGVPGTPITIELAHDTAEVSGAVMNKDGTGAAGAEVALFREVEAGKPRRWPLTGTTDQHGRFLIPGVRPGEYFAIAAEKIGADELGDASFARSCGEKARKLTARPDGSESIDLPLLSPEEMAAAREKRGM